MKRRRRRAAPDDDARAEEKLVHSADGTRIHATRYYPDAEPRACVVFVHGWVMGAKFWRQHALALAENGVLAVTYDQRGHGRSGRPGPDGCSPDAIASDLEAVLSATAPPDLPLMLVGHSMGGMTILAWSDHAHAGHHFIGAVLCNTAARSVVFDALTAIARTQSPLIHAGLSAAVHTPIRVPELRTIAPIVRLVAHGPGASPESVALTTEMVAACSPKARAAFMETMNKLDLSQAATHFEVPVLVVSASYDKLTPPHHSQDLYEIIPNADLRELTGGHQAPIEQPDVVIDLLIKHLNECMEG